MFNTETERRRSVLLLLIATTLRLIVGWVSIANLDADPDAYRAIATSLDQTGVYGLINDRGIASPTAFRPPLYPWILSWITTLDDPNHLAVLILHSILGGVTVCFTFLAARRIVRFTNDLVPLIATVLVLIDPILVQQSTLLMTETIATTLSAAVLWWCATWTPIRDPEISNSIAGQPIQASEEGVARSNIVVQGIVLGLLLSLAYLCRPTFLAWAVILVAAIGTVGFDVWKARLTTAIVAGLILVVFVAAWMIRNQRSIGHPVWATTHGGYTLLLANNPLFYDYLRQGRWGDVWNAETFFVAYENRHNGEFSSRAFWNTDWSDPTIVEAAISESKPFPGEVADDRYVNSAAMATIQRQPSMFAYSCLIRLGRLWAPFPHSVPGRSRLAGFAVGVFYCLVFAVGLLGAWVLRSRWTEPYFLAAISLALTLSAVHAIYWSNLRMRAPITPAMAVVAALGCTRIWAGKGPLFAPSLPP